MEQKFKKRLLLHGVLVVVAWLGLAFILSTMFKDGCGVKYKVDGKEHSIEIE